VRRPAGNVVQDAEEVLQERHVLFGELGEQPKNIFKKIKETLKNHLEGQKEVGKT
jgi:hypothetical protein